MRFFKKKRLLLLIISIFISIAILIEFAPNNEDKIVQKDDQYKDERIEIESLIDRFGAKKAYLEFKKTTNTETLETKKHILAHLFGEALYKKIGMGGVKVCDDSFSYGCYHSFLGEAIRDKGLAITRELDQECEQQFKNKDPVCQHGIGHGILTYLGYDERDLEKALEVCSVFPSQFPVGGCANGVFMEYNRRTMINISESPEMVRKLENDDYYFPCSWVSDRFKASCYDDQVHWWVTILGSDYKKVGKLCSQIGNSQLSEICVSSLGFSLPVKNDYNIEKIIDICDLMPTSRLVMNCRSSAAKRFWNNEKLSNEYQKLCEGLDSLNKKECLERALL